MILDRVPLERGRVVAPDCWERGDPRRNTYLRDGKNWVVQRRESDSAHVTTLTLIYSEPYGKCTCEGFEHRGICSHLCAVYRAWSDCTIELPKVRPTAIDGEFIDPGEERADAVT